MLDVGSGSNPHPAADVLIERYLDPKHRYEPLVVDRPLVLGDACRMPFKDKAFDFVIAFHVLEHMVDPALFLSELQRIGKAGYIETPNAIFERLVPYDVHLLEIMNMDGTLLIHKKRSARPDPFLNELDLVKRSPQWNRFFYQNPDLFHTRYFWKDHILFKVLNPETSLEWFVDPEIKGAVESEVSAETKISGLRSLGLSLLRRWHQFKKRRSFSLLDLLVCPKCRKTLISEGDFLDCAACRLRYQAKPVPDFNRPLNIGK